MPRIVNSQTKIPKWYIYALLIICAGCTGENGQQTEFRYFKLGGLNRLFQPAAFGSGTAYIHHALSQDGQLAPAGECGIGSLGDAAKAVLVYLRYAEISGETASVEHAKALLATIMQLQKPDGLFHDWIDARGRPTRCNINDAHSLSYSEVWAMWALAYGTKFLSDQDRPFAEKLHEAFWRSFAHVDSCLSHYGEYREQDGLQIPQWLPYRRSAAAASELILAFDAISQSALNDSRQSQRLERAMRQFAEGIQRMQAGSADQFPFGAHLAHGSDWHAWGNCAIQAVAITGAKFNQKDLIESAMLEADHFVPHLQKIQFAHHFNLLEARQNANRIDHFPQSAGDIRPLVTGLIELSRLTGNRRYAQRAGEIALWFRGKNAAHEAVYLTKTGLAKDYIFGRNYVMPTLTAAATVEALLAILEVEANRDSRKEFYVDVKNVFEGKP
ncbi:MAG: hypothetical protein ONB44_13825 [candidate division KSB1 bacterium]|nr:hypothetical protein [candidate division KSB1 bacterium]MDZ7303203.1 hypothetical protein [candidate division KSB1 bacterium]MDZ7312185.1 hypothetical protein [candidate division KSB1 bacterium]